MRQQVRQQGLLGSTADDPGAHPCINAGTLERVSQLLGPIARPSCSMQTPLSNLGRYFGYALPSGTYFPCSAAAG